MLNFIDPDISSSRFLLSSSRIGTNRGPGTDICLQVTMPDRAVTNLLITGPPGCGKTTLVKSVADHFSHTFPAGFITGEIRTAGARVGFMLTGFDGRTAILAHCKVRSGYRVGRYGVDIPGFERFLEGLPSMPEPRLVIVDEIGRMECLSPRFCEWVTAVLDKPVPCIATIAMKGDRFIESIKERNDVMIYFLRKEQRASACSEIVSRVDEMISLGDKRH